MDDLFFESVSSEDVCIVIFIFAKILVELLTWSKHVYYRWPNSSESGFLLQISESHFSKE